MAETYISARKRLEVLPQIFTGSDLTVRFQWPSPIASSYLAQWRKAGLVKSLGGRSDIHMNLVVNREPNLDLALARLYPRAIRIGIDVLRECGWTTQIPSSVDVAIPREYVKHGIDGYILSTRSEKWYASIAPGLERAPGGLDALKPAWAFADMMDRASDRRVRDSWLPDPEDLDMEGIMESKDLTAAMTAFGLSAASYETFYEEWFEAHYERARPKS